MNYNQLPTDAVSKAAQELYQEAWLLKEEMAVLTNKFQTLNRRASHLNCQIPETPEQGEIVWGEYSDCDWLER